MPYGITMGHRRGIEQAQKKVMRQKGNSNDQIATEAVCMRRRLGTCKGANLHRVSTRIVELVEATHCTSIFDLGSLRSGSWSLCSPKLRGERKPSLDFLEESSEALEVVSLEVSPSRTPRRLRRPSAGGSGSTLLPEVISEYLPLDETNLNQVAKLIGRGAWRADRAVASCSIALSRHIISATKCSMRP